MTFTYKSAGSYLHFGQPVEDLIAVEPTALTIAQNALREVGRDDLAREISWVSYQLDGHLEVNCVILDEDDWAVVTRAERLAQEYHRRQHG